ncbi:response regulator transcription factor [Sphingomonas glaciei]|uniref:Response regulator transcription factor n=1 Tax=Sphingomonas glaciei TaxID=2938948 RepID=A0ABY5MVE4_9SPHN|nr:response regulator transcription factor [Sphingomonas glaciei]UUR08455.1 response regulator transcription factor [Sphingomonas glaciei]
MRIALLEDDPSLADLVSATLETAGHTCHHYPDCRSAKVAFRQESFDLLLMDWHLPDGEGVDVLRWARQNLVPCPPVIMVTSRTEDEAVVAALDAGADDYVVKPIVPMVLLSRVAALLRRTYKPVATVGGVETHFGVAFDHGDCSVSIGGDTVALTHKEFGLALLLFQHVHRPLSRTYLLEAVWGRNPDLPTRTLDVHISRLRSRLGLTAAGFKLSSIQSFGYRLEMTSLQ